MTLAAASSTNCILKMEDFIVTFFLFAPAFLGLAYAAYQHKWITKMELSEPSEPEEMRQITAGTTLIPVYFYFILQQQYWSDNVKFEVCFYDT